MPFIQLWDGVAFVLMDLRIIAVSFIQLNNLIGMDTWQKQFYVSKT
ncbi:hypothetical protein DOT_1152 [Desulfosporosinus sp. OT]|nr:hypothetical protein DOT_1152 [Desulfosporosinus sp. OT]